MYFRGLVLKLCSIRWGKRVMLGAFYIFLIFVGIFLFLSTKIKWWIRLCLGVYQIIVCSIYTKQYNDIQRKYDQLTSTYEYNSNNEEHVANWESYLDARSNLLGDYEVYLHLPFIIFLIISYYKWIKNAKSKSQLIWILFSILPVCFVYFVITIFMHMLLAYQP